MDSLNTKPFLRWAGGKRWLTTNIAEILENIEYKQYHEPFLGGGSVFFSLPSEHSAFLSDINSELINAYQCMKDNPKAIYEMLITMPNTEFAYYDIRSQMPVNKIAQAARFIFLNHASYNGLYRVNQAGVYNVPYGKRKDRNYNIEHFLAVGQRLQNTELKTGDFSNCIDHVESKDLVYLDPPYVVAHENGTFVKYNQQLFSFEDQKRLKQMIQKINELGAYYILSNAHHDTIKEIFYNEEIKIYEPQRDSHIGGKNAKRGTVKEYIFTNIPNL